MPLLTTQETTVNPPTRKDAVLGSFWKTPVNSQPSAGKWGSSHCGEKVGASSVSYLQTNYSCMTSEVPSEVAPYILPPPESDRSSWMHTFKKLDELRFDLTTGVRYRPSYSQSDSVSNMTLTEPELVDREREFDLYLERLVCDNLVSATMKKWVTDLWVAVAEMANSRVPVPDTAPAGNGGVMLAFDNGKDHLELELLPSGQVEVFFLDRTTDSMMEWEYSSVSEIDSAFVDKLAIFSE